MKQSQPNKLKFINSGVEKVTLAGQSDECCPSVPAVDLKALIHVDVQLP